MARIDILLDQPQAIIRPELYGHFAEHLGACVDEGIWVGERSSIPNVGGIRSDVIQAIRQLSPPVVRWPGGCFADDYDWTDGIGPRSQRPRRVNAWWGHTLDDNHFGTHEFINFCRLVGAEPYLAGNVGSGSPRLLKQWVEYCNFAGDSTLARLRGQNGSPQPFNVRYWGVGNEAWGCGGSMCPEDYAAEYKRYSTYLSTFMREPVKMPLYLIAVGPNGNNADWTRRFFKKAGMPQGDWKLHGFAAHYYCGTAGAATQYSTNQWYELLQKAAAVEKLIHDQRAILDEVDPQRAIGLILDEWGAWHPPTPGRNPNHLWQQNTLRDALVAAISLDAFNRNADKLVMANIAQLANVLQAMVLTEGPRMLLTPTYHVFDLYQHHQGARGVRSEFEHSSITFAVGDQKLQLQGLSGSASIKNNWLTLSVVNPHASLPVEATINLRGGVFQQARIDSLSHEDIQAHNTFDKPHIVAPQRQNLEPPRGEWRCTFAPASVTVIRAAIE